VFSDHCRAQMVKDTSILDPLSPARTKILQGNRSRGAGRDLKWQESVATCKLTLRRLILTLSSNSRLRPVPLGTNGGEQFPTSPWGRTTHRPLTPGAERNKIRGCLHRQDRFSATTGTRNPFCGRPHGILYRGSPIGRSSGPGGTGTRCVRLFSFQLCHNRT
jgi:hypothetical protein